MFVVAARRVESDRFDCDPDDSLGNGTKITRVSGYDHASPGTDRHRDHGGVNVILRTASGTSEQVANPAGELPGGVGNVAAPR
jgi:hypothetical protein